MHITPSDEVGSNDQRFEAPQRQSNLNSASEEEMNTSRSGSSHSVHSQHDVQLNEEVYNFQQFRSAQLEDNLIIRPNLESVRSREQCRSPQYLNGQNINPPDDMTQDRQGFVNSLNDIRNNEERQYCWRSKSPQFRPEARDGERSRSPQIMDRRNIIPHNDPTRTRRPYASAQRNRRNNLPNRQRYVSSHSVNASNNIQNDQERHHSSQSRPDAGDNERSRSPQIRDRRNINLLHEIGQNREGNPSSEPTRRPNNLTDHGENANSPLSPSPHLNQRSENLYENER